MMIYSNSQYVYKEVVNIKVIEASYILYTIIDSDTV